MCSCLYSVTMMKFIFTCLIFTQSIYSAPISESKINDECDKIHLELTNIPEEKMKDELIRKVAMTRLEKDNKIDEINKELGKIQEKLELANEWAWFELMSQQIEYFEDGNFPQPCDDDFESKKVLWNKERLKGKSNFDLHEERRYQKFKYYLEHPPNEAVQKLRNRLDNANISAEVFSRGVAKAYRLISARFQDGYIKWLDKNLDEFFIQKDVLIAMEVLLDEMGISKKLIKKIKNAANKTKDGTKWIVNNSQKQ